MFQDVTYWLGWTLIIQTQPEREAEPAGEFYVMVAGASRNPTLDVPGYAYMRLPLFYFRAKEQVWVR